MNSSLALLSQGERALWFLHHFAPGGGAYNIAAATRVLTPIHDGTLERAIQALVDRHAALRTTFPAVGGEPCRQVSDHLMFALTREDATGWSEAQLRSRLAEEAWRPFDLERGPLLRLTLWTGAACGPVVLLVIHHIVADFWSLAILLRELPALYREAAGAGPARLVPPGLAYGEHVRFEQEALGTSRGETLLAYWRRRLAGLPPLEMVTDRPRPALQTYRGDIYRLALPAELTSSLRSRSRAQHGTLFMTLVAAFQALLCRHTGQEDLAIGSPRAGRSESQFAGTVGYFVNPVVLRGDLSGDPSFIELLERTRSKVLTDFEHGDYPLPLLAEHLQPDRDASRTPLFQVSLVLQKETRGVEGLTAFALGEEGVAVNLGRGELQLESLSLERPPTPFDLQLHAAEREGGLSFGLQYNSDLFDRTTATRLMERFATLLRSVAGSAELALSAVPILPEAERHQILSAWNDTADASCEANLFELFMVQAERTPETVALVLGEELLTYSALAERAVALAHQLAGLGVEPEVLVGVAAERSPELVIGLLAVLGAGGAYLPLEPSLPRQRLAMILEDARPAVLLTRRSQAEALLLDATPGVRLAWLDETGRRPSAAGRPLARAAADNAAYVIYTSGSTGRPKGVVNSHRGIVNRLLWMQEAFGLEESERFLQKTPLGFDVSVWELFTPLIAGGCLVMARPEGHVDSAYLADLVEREGITAIHFVPSLLPFFLDKEAAKGSLRRVIVSGEVLPWEVEQRCLAALKAPLYNLYGPTEAAVEVTVWTCQPSVLPRRVPIGRAIRNTRLHIVGWLLEPMPPGAAGELVIGGVQVARGYLGRPELTAERFVPDPWIAEAGGPPGARLYRTGDLCRYGPGGEIEFLGRLDDQVKIRGVRVEPREIELTLAAHPEVREVAVVVRPGGDAERSLLACVVLEKGEPDAAMTVALRDFVAARLPPAMVPSFAFGRKLDRLPNGKLDRRALSRWTQAPAVPRAPAGPRTPVEELLAGLFAEVLGIDRIGVEDSFFEYGGHSLTALRLMARVREALCVDLPPHRLFEAPTVAALARAIEGSTRSEAPPLVPVPRDHPLPLSFAQQRLWFLQQLEPASPVYNMPAAVHLQGGLDAAVLAAALGEVVRRHESLRTRFAAGPDGPVQVIDPPAPLPLPAIDLAGLPADRRTGEAHRLARQEALLPFDLARGPLLRVTLVRLNTADQLLLLILHHVVGDGWSLRLLAQELEEIYGAGSQGRPYRLPELEIQYGDYAVWQRRWLQGERLAAELAHWRTRLAGMPPVLDLPLDHPRSAAVRDRGSSRPLTVPAVLLHPLRELARRQGVTLFMTILAAFQALLSRVSGSEDVSVGTPVAGRGQLRTEGLIGFFVNTLVLRTDLSGDPSFTLLLGRVREAALAAYAHQDLPFEKLVEELQPQRDLGISPLFQVLLTLDSEPPLSLRLGDAATDLWPLAQETEKLDLSLTLGMEEEDLAGALGFRTDLFDGVTIERLAASFGRLLAGAVADPRQRLSELPLLSEVDRAQLLIEWNDAGTVPSCDTTLHGLFEAQAARTPEAIALVAGLSGERWTYRQLDLQADALARRLTSLGVGPEVRVGVCLTRTPFLVASLLAVLKAGGAYVPLDPDLPRERLAFLLEDAAAAVLLTEPGLVDRLPGHCAELLVMNPEGVPGARVPGNVLTGNLAYVIYTSGSTGQPKGVAIEHRSAVAFARWARTVFPPENLTGVLAATSVSFDLSVFELFVTLAWGGRVVLVANALELPQLTEAAAGEVALVNTVPSAMAELVRLRALPASVRTVNLAGEPLQRSLVEAIYNTSAVSRVLDLYGPSEDTTYSTWALAARDERREPAIGRPIAGTRVVLLGHHGELVPAGVAGELFLGGAGLARGYLARPDLTAERFVPDPFAQVPGERLYRTGDLARRRADGALEFLGRIDQQVKVRGFRVELGEIEAALVRHSEVREAAVVLAGDELVAWVAAGGEVENQVLARELRQLLRERLPRHMVPASFQVLPRLPLTPTGKVDRKTLAALRPERVSAPGLAARTPAEELLAGIFAEVLQLERMGIEESFFELGGHSLLATQVVSRVRALFGVELPVRTLFEAPTVEALAERIEYESRTAGKGLPPIDRVPRQAEMPLSFAQQRLWFLDQLQPGSPMYNIPIAVRLTGELDRAALSTAFNEIVRRHEVLRTTFRDAAGGPVQVVSAPSGTVLPVVDLAALPVAVRQGEAVRLVEKGARLPFDLAQDRMLRVWLLALEEAEHIALVALHHIASDGWSIGVLIRELAALYAAFREGRPNPLPELGLQYADYAAWQRHHLSGEWLAAQLAYWREQLAGAPEVLDLPTDRPRRTLSGSRGALRTFNVPRRALDGLTAVSRRFGATRFMSLLAAFAVVLQRYTGQDDLMVGTPVAGRTRVETENLIGLFVNTLVARIDLSGDPEVGALLVQVRDTMLAAFAYQEMPFERLVEELSPERDLGRPPLVQTMLILQNAPAGMPALPGLELEATSLGTGTAKFELTWAFTESGDGLSCTIEHSRDLFDSTTIDRLAGGLGRLLAAAGEEPGRRVSELLLLDDAELHQTTREWSDSWTSWQDRAGREICVAQLCEAQAARDPQAVALVCGRAVLSHGELHRRANRLAHWLRRIGVGPEARVGILLDRSLDMVVALLGVLKSGGAYVPLDPGLPTERLAWMADDAGLAALLTDERSAGALPVPPACPVLNLDTASASLETESEAHPVPWAAPDNLAYVIYTSGSTGRPKGVEVSGWALVNFLASMRDRPGLTAADTLLAVTTISFDIAALEIFLPLVVGARVVLASREEAVDGAALARSIAHSGATALQATPATWQTLMGNAEADLAPLQGMCGGEALDPGLANALVARTRSFWNLYGPTETTVWSTRQLLDSSSFVPIGRPISNTRVVLLDRAGHPVPLGAVGHLHIGGRGLARGYLHRPDLTAERFVPDPLPAEPGARLYRTGDLARFLADGTLDYLGRIDSQVKLRGFRIEPGEIEAVLRQHPEVREAAVVLLGGAGSLAERRLAAFVVAAGDRLPTADELRRFLQARLPAYMLPSFFTALPALPLTPTGKVDRKALAARGPSRTEAESGRPPRTPAEELVAETFAEVLKLDRVGADDSFFELGGHSLLATQVVSRVRALFGVELPVRTLFEAPTVEALAERIEGESRTAGEDLPPIHRVPRQDRMPLSFAQQRLWVLDQLQPGLPAYNLPAALRLAGTLAVEALERSFGEVIRRHEALRTRLPASEGLASQVIDPPAPFVLPQIDLSGLAAPVRTAESARLTRDESRRPFDLAAGPLVRPLLLRQGAGEHTLLVTIHHIVADGWSFGVLVRELESCYESFSAGEAPRLPELPIQYADYAVWQRDWLRGEVLEAQLAYWKHQLGGDLPTLELPADRPRPAVATFRGGRQTFNLPPLLGGAVERLGRAAGATAFMVLLAGFQTLLHRYTGQEDLPVGSPIAGRTRRETEPLIGLFVNTLALRGNLAGDPPVLSLLDRVRRTALDAYAHQDLPFEKLVDALQPQRDLSRTPLVQVLFNLRNAPFASLRRTSLDLEWLEVETGVSRFDLELSLADTGEGLAGELLYSSDLFDAATIGRLAAHLRILLEGMASSPERRLSELPLLSTAEVRQLLGDWVEPGPPGLAVHERLALQAVRTPDAAALVWKRERLTYRDLDRRANAVAHRLQELGVGPETPVGLFLERSPELVIGLLGIWKAGGAFLPLDPDYPEQRLELLLVDSDARVAVTRQTLAGRLPAGVAALAIEDVSPAGEPAPPAVAPRPENLAYVIYTSGSAGQPKGVLVEHGNLSHLMQATQREMGWDSADVMPCLAKFSFDIFLFELLGPLLVGGTSVLVPLDPVPDLEEVVRLLDDSTRLHAVPALMRQIVDWARLRGTAGRRLRTLFVGGDAVPVELLRDLREVFPRAELRVLYGPTEGTILATSHRVTERPERTLIGWPLPGMKALLKDRAGNLVPVGAAGEIHLGGVGVARGYLNREELSREKFFVWEGERWYRTGDLARRLPNGALEFLGRVDEQVKIRGIRVEPGEIEAALAEHPRVRESAVVARDGTGGRRLVAWVVPRDGEPPAAEDLRRFLRSRLPEHMVPAAFVALEALSLTAHGKVDRRALATRSLDDKPATESHPVAAGTAAEAALVRIWSEVLQRPEIGIHDNFFELGGDSILSIQIMARASQAGLRISPRQVFEHQTIAELAAVAGVADGAGAGQGPVTGAVPLTPVQHRFFERDLRDPHHFNQALMLRVRETLAPGVVERALAALLAHHDALRLRFCKEGDAWRQHEPPPGGATPLLWLDLSRLSPAAGGAALASAAEQVQASLDLAGGPITRVVWADLPQDEARLLWVVHHLAVDGVSWRVLLEDLEAACRQLARGEAVTLPPKTTSFQDWAERLVEHARALPLQPELSWWLTAAQGAAPLPLDAAGENTVASERTISTSLDEEETRALLQEVPQAYHTQVNDALLTALARTLAGPDGVLWIELEGHGREEIFAGIDLSRTVGWFTVEYPVCLAITPRGNPGADLKGVKEQLRAVPGRGIGYGLLRYLRANDVEAGRLRRLPSPEVSFNYLGQLDNALPGDSLFVLAEEPAGPPQSRRERRRNTLALNGWVIGGRLRIDWAYSEALHRRTTVEQWAEELAARLRELIAHCRSPEAGGYTPSDFDKVALRQEDLDNLLAELEEAMD